MVRVRRMERQAKDARLVLRILCERNFQRVSSILKSIRTFPAVRVTLNDGSRAPQEALLRK